TFTGVDINANGTPRVATYTFTPPGGSWDSGDYGIYTINMAANQVSDTGATPAFVAAGTIGSFATVLPLLVTNNNDGGAGSLRNAISLANSTPGALDTILFDATFFATAQTITLTSGEILISDAAAITWPAAPITINASATSRHFNISASVNIDNVVLT